MFLSFSIFWIFHNSFHKFSILFIVIPGSQIIFATVKVAMIIQSLLFTLCRELSLHNPLGSGSR